MGTDPRGYIIVKASGAEAAGGVIALSRGGKKHRPRWIKHATLSECFVHSLKSIRRAFRKRPLWTDETAEAYEASYNTSTTFAEPTGAAIPLSQLKEMLGPVGQTKAQAQTA